MSVGYRTAIITGASSGLGAELARQLALEGVSVGLSARREAELNAVATEIRAAGGTAQVVPADAADREATRRALEELASRLGAVDLLIANAGVGIKMSARDFSAADVEQMVRVNLLGAVYAIEAVLPGMLERGRGQIVGMSSLAGHRGLPGAAGYCATKAGLTTLLEGLRVELRGTGIGITTVHPGYVRTPMTARSDHPRPFLMEVEPAARTILRGIVARRRVVNFPVPMAALMGFVRAWPVWLYDPLAARLLNSRSGARGASPSRSA